MRFSKIKLFVEIAELKKPFKTEIEKFNKIFDNLKAEDRINSFRLLEDNSKPDFDFKLHRFHITFKTPNNREISGTGVDFQRNKALLKAFAESYERFLFLDSNAFTSCYNYKTKKMEKCKFNVASSNGIAIHNSIEGAVLNSYCELVERHLFAEVWYKQNQKIYELNTESFDFINDLKKHIQSQNSEFKLVLLGIVGGVYVVSIIARSYFDKTDYNLLISTGAHYNLISAIKKAYYEFSSDYISKPKRKREKLNIQKIEVNSLQDHGLYYQDLGKLKNFDFLFKSFELKEIEDVSSNVLNSYIQINEYLKDKDFNLYFNEKDFLSGFFLIKAESKNLNEIQFGKDHLNSIRSGKIVNFEPHPIE